MGFPCPHAPLCMLNMYLEMALRDTGQAVSSAGIPDETDVEEGENDAAQCSESDTRGHSLNSMPPLALWVLKDSEFSIHLSA